MKMIGSQYDPFSMIDESLHDLVLQHLTGSDVLKMTEVSREWNQLITKTNDQESKIQLSITENWGMEFDADVVKNTTRKYSSIKVNTLLRTRNQVFKLFCNFAEFLITVNTRFDFDMNGLKLPSVKSLAITMLDYPHFFENGLLSSVNGLMKLEISGKNPFPEKIVECLQSNPGLIELVLEEGAENAIKCLNEPVNIKLKVLKMNKAHFTPAVEANFVKFLASQIDSLQELKLLHCDFMLMCRIFNNMKNLRRLTFSPSNRDFFQSVSLKPQENLEELNLILVSSLTLQSFLQQTPNLKKLYISDPTSAMFKFVIDESLSIEEFRFSSFRGVNVNMDDVIEFYEHEISNDQSNINKRLKIIQI